MHFQTWSDKAGNAPAITDPTNTQGVAMGAVNALTADGLSIGQSPAFFAFLNGLAEAADQAQRGS
jgi:hypothetical protein